MEDIRELFRDRKKMIDFILKNSVEACDVDKLKLQSDVLLAEQCKLIFNNIAQQASSLANISTGVLDVDINGKEVYKISIADLHDDFLKFIQILNDIRKIPNAKIILEGDLTSDRLKSAKGFEYDAKNTPSECVDQIVKAIEITGTKHLIESIINGNHEEWLRRDTSFSIAKIIADRLGIPEKYRETREVIRLHFVNNKKPCVIMLGHGDELGSNSGSAAEKCLEEAKNYNADIVIKGNNHKFGIASVYNTVYNPQTKSDENKLVTYVNLGQYPESAFYGDRAGYAPLPTVNGEIMHIISTGEKYIVDFDFMSKLAENKIYNELDSRLLIAQKEKRNSVEEIIREYTLIKQNATSVNNSQTKKRTSPQQIVIVPLGKSYIGYKDDSGREQLKKRVQEIKKIPDARVFLCGDMIYDDNNGKTKKNDHSKEVISRLQMLADDLKPIKDCIIGYNSGIQEKGIMEYYSMELAKRAMKVAQLDYKNAYMPMTESEIEEQKIKIQADKVEDYNEKLLDTESAKYPPYSKDLKIKLNKYTKSINKEIEENWYELKEYGGNPDFIKLVVSAMLNDETYRNETGKYLLKAPRDNEEINKMFSISDDEILKPHVNLIQNTLFTMLGIERKIPKIKTAAETDLEEENIKKYTSNTIGFNSIPNSPTYVEVPIKTKNGKRKNLLFNFQYLNVNASRGAIYSNMIKRISGGKKVDALFVLSSSSKEFLSKTKSSYIDPITAEVRSAYQYLVSVGGLCEIKGRIQDERFPVTKVYECFYAESYFKSDLPNYSTYADNENEIFHLAPKEYDIYHLNMEDILRDNVNNRIKTSLEQAIDNFHKERNAKEKAQSLEFFKEAPNDETTVENKPKKSSSKKKPTTKTNKPKSEMGE